MGNLVLIGGGRYADTAPLIHELASLTEKPDPRIVILPTAALNSAGEQRAFQVWQEMFEPVSTCIVPLFLMQKRQEKEVIAERLQQADIVFVPSGDTGMMLKLWRRSGVDEILTQVYGKGVVLAGMGAGANAWCRCCISADRPKKTSHIIRYRTMWGLGLLDVALCTRYPDRREPLHEFLQEFGGVGLGLDNNQALIVQDDRYRLHNLHEGINAYKLTTVESAEDSDMPFVVSSEQQIEADGDMRPLEDLLAPDHSA